MSEVTSWKEFFENFHYKPNFMFVLQEDVFYDDLYRLTIVMVVPDSRWKPGTNGEKLRPLTRITRSVVLDNWVNEHFAKRYIRDVVHIMEDHEINEWFSYKGELPFDPHQAASDG